MQNNTQKPFGTGALLKKDKRDHEYKLPKATLPEVLPTNYATGTPAMLPVLMQAQRPSCVSHMAVRLLRLWWWKKTGELVNFSPRFLHAMTSYGMKNEDGRDPRRVMQVLKDFGCCTEALLPNDVSLSDKEYSRVVVTNAMIEEAKKYKIPAYSFPGLNSYSIRHAIYHHGAVGLLFYIGSEWWLPSWAAKYINPLRAPKAAVGGHEVTGEHWHGTLDGLQNSWSEAWCEAGFADYDFSKYSPVQVVCIDDPQVDFNPHEKPTFKFKGDLYFGMTHPDVKELQKRLGMPEKYWTGYFGWITLMAVTNYQIANNIFPTLGYCGIKTRTLLNSTT